jgi:hypothetical protein
LAGGKAAMVSEIPALPPAFHVAGGKAGISKFLICFFYFASQQQIQIYHTDPHIYHTNPHI